MNHDHDIQVYENVFDPRDWEYIWKVVRFPRWQFGHVSTNAPGEIPFWVMDLKDDPFFSVVLFRKIVELLQRPLVLSRVYANGATFGQSGGRHTDSLEEGATTFLIYANREWNLEWGGRTVFLVGDDERVIAPKPGTAVHFRANIPHFSEDVGRKFTGLRVTVAYKLSVQT